MPIIKEYNFILRLSVNDVEYEKGVKYTLSDNLPLLTLITVERWREEFAQYLLEFAHSVQGCMEHLTKENTEDKP